MRTCSQCAHIMRFDERFEAIKGALVRDPAWICLNPKCRYEERVRRAAGA